MSVRTVGRWTLAVAAALVVAWSFFDVGHRAYLKQLAEADRPIVLTTLQWGDPAEDKIVQTLVEEYEAAHPKVHITRINAGDSFDSKLKTMMAAGTPPDLFYLPPRLLPELASLKLIRPVDDYVAKEKLTPEGRAFFADVYPILLHVFSYDVAADKTGSGQLYGLPKDSTTTVMYVNLDLFAKAGVTVPYGGWTWDEFEVACRKITALTGTPGFEDQKIYGANFEIWPDTLRNVLWTFGGEFFGPGGFRDVGFGSPGSQEALSIIARLRLGERTAYNATGIAKDGGEEFIAGHIGIEGPVGEWKVPRYKDITSFRWDVVPVPHKAGLPEASQMFTTAWTMSAATPYPDVCFDLMKFLCGPTGAKMQSELGLAIPPLKSIANSPAFLDKPNIPRYHADIFLRAIPLVRLAQSPREQEWEQIVTDRVPDAIQLGTRTPAQVADDIRTAWLTELDSPLRRGDWGPFPWGAVIAVAAGGIVTLVSALAWKARREKLGAIDRRAERAGFSFIAPWLIGFLGLTAGPMIVSLLLSLGQWTGENPIGEAKWVGAANYHQMLVADPTFLQSLKVTLYFVALAVPISQVTALGVALLMNLRVRGITIFRTIYFVPSVVSGVALSVLWLQIFNNDYGLLNTVLRKIHLPTPDWFGVDAHAFAIPAFVIMGLWGVGGGMIIYLAGLKGVPASLYEAARIDGAGPLRRFWNVTLPMLSPLLFYNLIMGIIGSFQVFTQALVMTDGGPGNATLFYVLNLYRQAFVYHNMGYASAMAWVLFVICLGLTALVFRGSRKLVYYEGLK